MARRTKSGRHANLHSELLASVKRAGLAIHTGTLRTRVQALVPVQKNIRKLGKSLVDGSANRNAHARIIAYLIDYVGVVIPGPELCIVAGIDDWARRVRELRVEHGWPIYTGVTVKAIREAEEPSMLNELGLPHMVPSDYILINAVQDIAAAKRWKTANSIRRQNVGVRDKVLNYLRANVGQAVTGEELRYVAKNKTEWARRCRELRTEFGWPVVTRNTGRPDLPVGVYLLEQDRQSPTHDRRIPDVERRAVLIRDKYTCTKCGWKSESWDKADPRNLELHHVQPHVRRGQNLRDNLITVCTVCHDDIHRSH